MLTELEGIHMQSISSWPLQIDFVFLTKCRAHMKQKCSSIYFKFERKKGDNENKTENSLLLLLGASKTKRIPSNEKYILSTRIRDVAGFFQRGVSNLTP